MPIGQIIFMDTSGQIISEEKIVAAMRESRTARKNVMAACMGLICSLDQISNAVLDNLIEIEVKAPPLPNSGEERDRLLSVEFASLLKILKQTVEPSLVKLAKTTPCDCAACTARRAANPTPEAPAETNQQ